MMTKTRLTRWNMKAWALNWLNSFFPTQIVLNASIEVKAINPVKNDGKLWGWRGRFFSRSIQSAGRGNGSYRHAWPTRQNGEATMGITKSTVKVGQKPTKEQLKQIKELAKKPIHYTVDCPESTPEALAEFAAIARTLRKRKPKPMVALRVESDALEKYKALGEGYTGIMADVLNYVANNPELLSRASGLTVT